MIRLRKSMIPLAAWIGFFVGGTMADAGEAERFYSVADDGRVRVGEITLALGHFGPEWKMTRQRPASIAAKEGYPRRVDEGFELVAGFKVESGVFQLTQRVIAQGESAFRYEAGLAHPDGDGVETRQLYLGFSLPREGLSPNGLLVDGAAFAFDGGFDPGRAEKSLEARRLEVALEKGVLVLEGFSRLRFTDNRRYDNDSLGVRLYFQPADGLIRQSSIALRVTFKPYKSVALDPGDAANMGFADEVADDGQGGWTDQGPDNDLRVLAPGRLDFGGVFFDIADEKQRPGRTVLALRGKARPAFPRESAVAAGDAPALPYLYLLHATAWSGNAAGAPVGTVTVEYAEGPPTVHAVENRVNVGNFWNPRDLPAARVAWKGENESSAVGLYAARLDLASRRPTRVTLTSAEKAVWLVAGLSLSDCPAPRGRAAGPPLTMKAGARWFAARNRSIAAGSALDFSDLLDAPAGKHGRLLVDGDRFVFEKRPDTPVKFHGTNLVHHTNLPAKPETAVRVADDIARRGYNVVRLHHFDHEIVDRHDGKGAVTLLPERMERMDRLLFELRRRGVYATLDLFTARRLPADFLANDPEPKGGAATADADAARTKRPISGRVHKALCFLEPAVLDNLKTFSANLLNHVNPHTGLAYKDDPQFVFLGLINEDEMFSLFAPGGGVAAEDKRVKAALERAFARHLAQRGRAGGDGEAQADADRHYGEFLSERYLRTFEDLRGFLRGLGVRMPLSDQNMGPSLNSAALRAEAGYDYVDNHEYWAHPSFPERAWRLPAVVRPTGGLVAAGARPLAEIGSTRQLGKPFTVTEWCQVFPNPHAAEGSLVTAAFAGLQGWNGLFHFAYAHAWDDGFLDNENAPVTFFDTIHDPLRRLGEQLGALLFLRGDVRGAEGVFPLWMDTRSASRVASNTAMASLRYRRLGLVGKIGLLPATAALPEPPWPAAARAGVAVDARTPPAAAGERRLHDHAATDLFARLAADGALEAGAIDAAEERFSSDTGELRWDLARGTLSVATARGEGFILPEGGFGEAALTTARARDGAATVYAVSRDGAPLPESRRLLLFHLSEITNDGLRYRDGERELVEDWGAGGLLMRRARTEWSIRRDLGAWRLYALDFSGRRLAEFPFAVENGVTRATLDNRFEDEAVAAYEWLAPEP